MGRLKAVLLSLPHLEGREDKLFLTPLSFAMGQLIVSGLQLHYVVIFLMVVVNILMVVVDQNVTHS